MNPKWGYIEEALGEVYGKKAAKWLFGELQKLAQDFPRQKGKDLKEKISEKDAALIIYANSIIDKTGRKKPLQVLEEFIDKFKLKDIFTVVHILPFYPWDTDRGFSVKDYFKVNPEYGDWEDIKRLSKKVRLMFDFVLNHASVENPLVQKALIERHLDKDDPRYKEYEPYKDFVIAYNEEDKPSEELLKKLARPRPNPVLTPYVVYEVMEEDTNLLLDDTFATVFKKAQMIFQMLEGEVVESKALNDKVRISRSLWDHLVEKSRGRIELMTRFFALPKLIPVIQQGRLLSYKKYEKDSRLLEFWAIGGVVDDVAVKVVIRRINGGNLHVISVVWKGEISHKKNGAVSRLYPRCRGIFTPPLQEKYTKVLQALSTFENNFIIKTNLKACLGDKPLPEDKGKVVRILGKGYVWTTFSRPKRADGTEDTRQVDLNYANPKVFLEAVKIILFYIQKGAKFLRLDATAYLWKELGTPSVHLRKTHLILRAIRAFLDMVAPDIVFIAEVNERQSKVFEYFGDESQVESDLVYQFTNFALALYSLLYQDGRLYAKWYKTTEVARGRQFITVLGSHDGMGVKPLRDLLTTDEIENFAQRLVKEHGGLPNFAFLPGGKKIVYEVCSTPWNLINGEKWKGEKALRRYFLIVALGLMVKGLPAFYINGLFGAKNYFPPEGLDENRTVNRQVFEKQELFPRLEKGFHAKVLKKLVKVLRVKSNLRYFSPWKYFPEVTVLNGGKVLKFEFKEKGDTKFLALYNLSEKKQKVDLGGFRGEEVFGGKRVESEIGLPGFSFVWAEGGS